ncbi:cell division protein Fic [Pantoea agglomerans Eh318]|nr:cell division protein Fic [Pantoea agglomerans Eh318]
MVNIMKYNGTDKYCYEESPGVLINKFDILDDELLDRRIMHEQMQIIDDIKIHRPYSLETLCAIHKKLFSCAFEWAGELRDIDISKGSTRFCSNPYLTKVGEEIFKKINRLNEKMRSEENLDISDEKSINYMNELGELISDLNMLHPFREGNGRTLRLFIELFLFNLGINISWPTSPERWMKSSICDDKNGFTSLLLENISND